ncbi:MAG: hypothetical protein WC373_11725 [Smithella sp.]|jgi:hypothetical protein
MIQLGEPLNRKKTIKCQSCGDRILYVLHDRKAGDRLRFQDVCFLQAAKTTVRSPLYCAKCDEPWINKSTGRVICLGVPKAVRNALRYDCKTLPKKSDNDTFKYFKPMIEDCKASKIKPSELISGIPEDYADAVRVGKDKKDKDCKAIPLKDGFYMADKGERYFLIKNGMYIPQFQPITGPGIPEMFKAEKAKKRTGYKADSIIIDECKPLTRRQIKESNDALNKLNANKPTKRPVEDKNLLLRGKGKKLSDVVTGLDGFCMIGKKRGSK